VAELTPGAEAAIEKGLEHLVSLQDPKTGCFGDRYRVASTSLGGLALLASGESCGRGRYAVAIEDALRYVISVRKSLTQFGKPGHYVLGFGDGKEQQGKMHSHGLAMLFLAEVYGQTPRDPEVRETLRGAVATTIDAQTDLGGWGYHLRHEPEWGEDEASVTITQIQALRAVRNAGIYVPPAPVRRAIGYVRKSMTAEGACRYSLTMGGAAEKNRTSFELTAAAVATLNASGVYLGAGAAGDELERGLAHMRKLLRAHENPARAATDFYFYGNFYAAQAMYQATPDDWEFWFPRVRQDLLEKQRPKGHWESPRNFGDAYATASALVILQLPRRYLPILQR
jgi:hypothetical protein